MFWLFYFICTIPHILAAPTYFTIWLNNGNKLTPFLPQLKDQNARFNDVLIVDDAVKPFVTDHSRVLLDKPLFEKARTNHPSLAQKVSSMESVYDRIKLANPAAASDILRVVSFLGLDGNEFVYHDVDVKIQNAFTGSLSQPMSSAMIGTRNMNHLSKNWELRAILYPTQDANLMGANINTDLICVSKSEAIDILTEYIEKVCTYFDNSLTKEFISSTGRRTTLQDIVTTSSDETFTLVDINEYMYIVGHDTPNSLETRNEFTAGLSRKAIQMKFTFAASIYQYESVLQRIFNTKYLVPLPPQDEDDPYAIAERRFKLSNLELRGDSQGVINFILDYIADPIVFGAVTRKNTIDWQGDSSGVVGDVETLDAEPIEPEASDTEDYSDYEEYDENADLRALDENAIDIGSLNMFCGTKRKRSLGSICNRDDPDKYTMTEDAIMFDGKEVTFVSRFVYLRDKYKRYKYTAIDSVKRKLTTLKSQLTANIERILRLPSGRQAMYNLRNQYMKLEDPIRIERNYKVIHGTSSPLIRRFNRMKFAVGYATMLAFSTQFLAHSIYSNEDIAHKIALGTIGTAGLTELGYKSATGIARLFGKSLSVAAAVNIGRIFKTLNVATAIYFLVDSSIVLSKNPHDLKAWYWLSRSITLFTPLNKFFIPIDITLIVTKQIISASWSLAIVQNNILLTRAERTHFHALSFFGVSTAWTSNVQNGGIFKANVVNPTVNKLRSLMTDAYGVVGYPTTTICKTTERVIYNNYNDYYTDLKTTRLISLPTIRDSLSPARMRMCLADVETQCAPQELTGWEWFVAVIAQTSRVRHRGADFGVGCVLLDGTTLTGPACGQIERMRQDLRNREKIFVVLAGSTEYVLPFVNPEDYDFNFISVANGTVIDASSSECQDMLKWNKIVAPYILVNPRKHGGRIDYLGIPASESTNTAMTTIDNYPARVYVYKPNKNNKRNHITVSVSNSYDNEFIIMEIEDYWRLEGKNKLIVRPTNLSVLIADDYVLINNMTTVINSTIVSIADSTIVVTTNQTAPVLHLTTCSIAIRENAIVTLSGRDNAIKVDKFAMANIHITGGRTNITVDSFASVVLTVTDVNAIVTLNASHLSKIVVFGLSADWTINKSINNNSITIDNKIVLVSGSVILKFQNCSVIISVESDRETVICTGETNDSILNKLVNPIVISVRNETILEHIRGNFTVPTFKNSFIADAYTNVTIPYQCSKKLNFYGANITVSNMMTCEVMGNCTTMAHINCTDTITVCVY